MVFKISPLKNLSIFLSLFALTSLYAEKNNPFIHFPEINPDGTKIAFCYQGDIWELNLQTSHTARLTIHEAYDSDPRWSPDGTKLAFTSNRMGNNDVYIFSNLNVFPERLTFHYANDEITGWKDNNTVLFNTSRVYRQVEWDQEIYQVHASGGTPNRLLNNFGYDASSSPNGKFIAFTHGSCRIAREEYKGSANRDIWIYDQENKKYIQLTTFEGNDFLPRWTDDQTLFYLSAVNGRYNIYKLKTDKSGNIIQGPEAITHFKETGITHFSIDNQGKTAVFDQGDKIMQLDIGTGKTNELIFTLPLDYRFDPIERKTYTKSPGEYVVSPDEKLVAFIVRGEVFIKHNNKESEKSRAKKITDTPAREMGVQWLNDSVLMYLSDREGQYDIYIARSDDPKEPNLFKTLKIKEEQIFNSTEDEADLVVSPDYKKLAFRQGRGVLKVADITEQFTLEHIKELRNDWSTPEGVNWSPDSKWLAYSVPDLNFNVEIYLQKADNTRKPVNVSLHPKYDYNPVWAPDGKKLFFLSERNNGDVDVWLLWLTREDWEKTKADWLELQYDEKEESKNDSVNVAIDFEDIHKRLVQVTSMPGNEDNLAVDKKGEFVYYSSFNGFRQAYGADSEVDLYKIRWDGTKLKRLTNGNSRPSRINLSPKGGYVYFINGKTGLIQQLDIKTDKTEAIPFTAILEINHPAEKEQIFDEACRQLDLGFYDPQFHNKDWEAIKNIYRPLCMKTSTIHDFRRVFNQMLGQLNSSHMGLKGGENPEKLQKETAGELGIEVKSVKKGVEITFVVKNSPADKKGVELKTGDIITGINGFKIDGNTNFFKLLSNAANEKIILNIASKTGDREVVTRPVSNMVMLNYNQWVDSRKKIVEELSGGRLGYIHIRGMGIPSFENFVTELTATGQDKEALIIDVRYNGGGWTTDYLMAVLNVKQHAYTIPRGATDNLEKNHGQFAGYYPYGPRLPMTAWMKPSVALCNSNSYSNAEIFSHAFKSLGIGPLVGQPTFGAVISTGGYRLIDGSLVRMPFRAWYVKENNLNMEGNPAIPDHTVLNPPDYKSGKDKQLEMAIKIMLEKLNAKNK